MLAMQNMRGVSVGGIENDFVVTMLDSSKKEFKSAIYTDSATKKHFIVYIDKKYKKTDTNRYKKIYPSQTLNLVCVLVAKDDVNDNPGEYVPGIPTDSCWMFKVISGHISVYSFLVKNQSFPILPSTFVGLQLNGGPIIPYNEASLKSIIADDSDAMESFQKKKYEKAIKRYNSDMEKKDKN